ncbi:MAG: glutaredoxin family protein [Planctomycetaceae bacterium]|nr:glutaredoxin family protein [Planctomycetaceae bacterium]
MAGTLSLLLGFFLALIVLTVRLNANWGILSRVVARNPIMCWGIAVALMAAGAVLLKQHSSTGGGWRPRIPGQRFRDAVLYTRSECPLCDEAVRTLSTYDEVLPAIQKVDVDSDPDFKTEFGNCVPVLALDGRVRFRGHISEPLLRRLIEGTPPT